jgi:hypothetical protein
MIFHWSCAICIGVLTIPMQLSSAPLSSDQLSSCCVPYAVVHCDAPVVVGIIKVMIRHDALQV